MKFSVDLFNKATVADTRPEKDTKEYIEYCREAGWQHIYTNGKLQFFYSELEHPTPIETNKFKYKI